MYDSFDCRIVALKLNTRQHPSSCRLPVVFVLVLVLVLVFLLSIDDSLITTTVVTTVTVTAYLHHVSPTIIRSVQRRSIRSPQQQLLLHRVASPSSETLEGRLLFRTRNSIDLSRQPTHRHHQQPGQRQRISSRRSNNNGKGLLFQSATSGVLDSIGNNKNVSQSSSCSELSPFMTILVRLGMMTFIAAMCIALPLTLYPQKLLLKLGWIDRQRKERWALATGQFCARTLLRIIPFCTIETSKSPEYDMNPKPTIWVCNHTSMLDVFLLLASDKQLRGPKKRPIKIVYWKALEDNPVTALLFRQSGFIPVVMAPNKPGEENEYDIRSFKQLLKDVKRAFDEDFDVALLPEGQLNPTPELGLQPVFSGAYTLAKMSKRPIHMMALYGIHKLWHPNPDIGMAVTGRTVKIRTYPHGRTYSSAEEFKTTFETVVGRFGATGMDFPDDELEAWLTGDVWKRKTEQEQTTIA